MRKIAFLLAFAFIVFAFASCSSSFEPDYKNVLTFESDLNAGVDVEGKTVKVTILEVHPDSAFGFNLFSGEHLNFVSQNNPGFKVGDSFIAKVTKVTYLFGSYIIAYDVVK